MQSLEAIKKRVKSVQTTAKITNAMKLVAAAKIKKQRNIFLTTSNYSNEFYNLMAMILENVKSLDFLIKTKEKKESKLWIVITSSLGLCGAYNNNICKMVLSQFKKGDKLAIFGKKGLTFFQAKQMHNDIIFQMPNDVEINFYSILPLCYKIVESFSTGLYNQINICYTKFINSLKFDSTTLNIFPIDKKIFEERLKNKEKIISSTKVIDFEPSKETIIKNILPLYVSTIVYCSIMESSLCENSSRRNTMDSATKNAQNIIDNLKLIYNQVRQESITQEINEIVAGTDN